MPVYVFGPHTLSSHLNYLKKFPFFQWAQARYRNLKLSQASRRARDFFKPLMHKAGYPLFTQITLETVSRCNNDCPFCPANNRASRRPHKLMPLDMLHDILVQLKHLNFTGIISLFCNNEPLLDVRMPNLVNLCKQVVPEAKTEIWTNGLLLSFDLFAELMRSGLDSLHINNYHDDFEFLPAVARFIQDFQKSQYYPDSHVSISLRKKNEILSTRGGKAPNNPASRANGYANCFCILPFTQFNVNPDGIVVLCCVDALYQETMGDLKVQSLADIWSGEKFTRARNLFLAKQSHKIPLCAGCDNRMATDEFYLENGSLKQVYCSKFKLTEQRRYVQNIENYTLMM